MQLTDLRIELCRYGDKKGQYNGTATFSGGKGSVTLNLDEKHCERIFQVCAEGIVEVAQDAARNLTCRVIEQQMKVESKLGIKRP